MNSQRISKVYDYRDTAGNLLFQTVRMEPKSFLQRRPFNDGHVWGLSEGWYQNNGQANNYYRIKDAIPDKSTAPTPDAIWFDAVQPVLYRLPEVLQGIKDCETIFICEGEKDADNLAALGFIATTCPMGAGKWQKAYTDAFQGCCEAVIVADKDNPGRAHAQMVANELNGVCIIVKVMEMPDINGSAVKDISDWLTAGGPPAALLELLNACPRWSPSQKEPSASASSDLQSLISQYGDPYYLSKDGAVTAINQSFWASLHQAEHIQLFEPDEREFYRYDSASGLYSVISEDTIKQEIAARILDVSRDQSLPSL
jgi:DNA primase